MTDRITFGEQQKPLSSSLLNLQSSLSFFVSGANSLLNTSGVHRNFVRGGGVPTNSVVDRGQRERGSGGGGGPPPGGGSGGGGILVQEISFHMVKIFLIFGTSRLFNDDNQFICHCQCKTIANRP